MDLNISPSPPSSIFRENPSPNLRVGFSLDLDTPPPPSSNGNGFFYEFLHKLDTEHLDHVLYFTSEGSSSDPFAPVDLTLPYSSTTHFIPRPSILTRTNVPQRVRLHMLSPPTTPSLPLYVDASAKSGDDSIGVAAHGEFEFNCLFNCSPRSAPVDRHLHHDRVMVDCRITPSLEFNDLGSVNGMLGERVSSGGVTSLLPMG